MTPRKNRVDRFLERLKRKPIVVAIMAIGAVVIALSSFTDATQNLVSFVAGIRGPSAEEARAELSRLSVNYSEETFIERAEQGDDAATRLFLAAGMNVNATNRQGISALMRAATRDDPAIIRTLIAAKADPNQTDVRGDTALSFAAARGRRENLELLLEAGARPEAIDRAFVSAAQYGQQDIARLLLDRGANVRAIGGEALVRAITQDSSSAVSDNVSFVVSVVSDVSAQDANGWSAVHLAASQGNAPLMRLLLEKGADVNRVCVCKGFLDARDWTALQMAARRSRTEVVQLLLARDADHQQANSRGATALHQAVEGDTPAIVRALLDKGADTRAKDTDGKTPLDYASEIPDERTRAEIIRMLK